MNLKTTLRTIVAAHQEKSVSKIKVNGGERGQRLLKRQPKSVKKLP